MTEQQTPEQVIAQVTERVLTEHRIVILTGQPGFHGERYLCEAEDCDYDTNDPTAWEEHVAPVVAAEVVAALGLREPTEAEHRASLTSMLKETEWQVNSGLGSQWLASVLYARGARAPHGHFHPHDQEVPADGG